MSARSALIDLAPLRASAPFRRLWASGLLSGLGQQVAVVAVLFQVWDLTRNPFWVGAIGLAQAVPMIVMGLLGGPLADLFDRRTVGMWSTGGQAGAALLLAAQLVLGAYPLPLLLGLLSLQTACSALGAPARRTFTVRLLPRPLVPAGVALLMLSFQLAMLVGPALGGVLVAAVGPALCYLVNACALAVSCWAVWSLPPMPPRRVVEPEGAEDLGGDEHLDGDGELEAAGPDPVAGPVVGEVATAPGRGALLWSRTRRGLSHLAEGVSLVAKDPVLRGSFLLDLGAMVLSFPVALFPMVNQQLFAGDPRTLGLFMSALAVGGATAGLASGVITRSPRLGRAQLVAVLVWGVALLGVGLGAAAGPAWVVLAALMVAGAADTASVTSRAAMVQLATPDSHLGRVSAVEHVVGVAGPDLGNARAGLVAGLTTPSVAAVLGGAACLAVTGVVALTHREVGRFRVGHPHRP